MSPVHRLWPSDVYIPDHRRQRRFVWSVALAVVTTLQRIPRLWRNPDLSGLRADCCPLFPEVSLGIFL